MNQPNLGRDPAVLRFAIINIVRILGVVGVLLGILTTSGRILSGAPQIVGFAFLSFGVMGAFVLPPVLVRKWRTPK